MPTHQTVDIYQGVAPNDLALYSLSEAAHYLHQPPATLRAWAVGRYYEVGSETRHSQSLIRAADPKAPLLSFNNLVELHVLSSIRWKHQVKLPAVRRAIKYIQKQFGSEHPLLDQQMLTDGKDLFIERYGELVTISRGGQMALRDILGSYLERIDRDDHGIPIRLYPFTRTYGESLRVVAIDPHIRFGKPCISGTRIPTAIIAERFEAGDSVEALAEDYGRPREEIEEAIRYESRIAS